MPDASLKTLFLLISLFLKATSHPSIHEMPNAFIVGCAILPISAKVGWISSLVTDYYLQYQQIPMILVEKRGQFVFLFNLLSILFLKFF